MAVPTVMAVLLCLCLCPSQSSPVLDNYPITFSMSGATTYTPDAGGASRSGYQLRVGYYGHSWLAAEIITGTDKNDVLVMEINEFYTEGSTAMRVGHEVTVKDYYRTSDSLNLDQNTQKDISTFSYSATKDYHVDLVRFMGANSGQDWNAAGNGYSLMQVCFYTSTVLFNINKWKDGLKQCYFFEIDNYVSTFKGTRLKTMYLNGYSTGIYGYIDGPYVSSNVYFYHNVPLFAYTRVPALAIEIGTTAGKVGQDFNVFSTETGQSGDYFGKSVTNMTKDSFGGGYENNGLSLKHWNALPTDQIPGLATTTLRIDYRRNISTYDSNDRQLQSTFIFCLYLYATGTINSDLTDKNCEVVELEKHYPQMAMPVRKWQHSVGVVVGVAVVVVMGLW